MSLISKQSIRDEMRPLHWAYFVSGLLWPWALTVGGFSAALGWRPGAWLLLGAVGAHIALDVAVGVTAYRDVMSRPWPPVAPLRDDEDW